MNNLFQAFSIEIPGELLDDKRFYEYADFDGENYTAPTDVEVLAKAKAFVRMQHIKRKLSECTIPLYCTVDFGTAGTAGTVPSNAKIVVGYLSYEPFISTISPVPEFPTEAEAQVAASGVIKDIIDKALNSNIEQEYAVLQKLYSLEDNPIAKQTHPYREVYMDYIDVEKPAAAVASTVTYIKL